MIFFHVSELNSMKKLRHLNYQRLKSGKTKNVFVQWRVRAILYTFVWDYAVRADVKTSKYSSRRSGLTPGVGGCQQSMWGWKPETAMKFLVSVILEFTEDQLLVMQTRTFITIMLIFKPTNNYRVFPIIPPPPHNCMFTTLGGIGYLTTMRGGGI